MALRSELGCRLMNCMLVVDGSPVDASIAAAFLACLLLGLVAVLGSIRRLWIFRSPEKEHDSGEELLLGLNLDLVDGSREKCYLEWRILRASSSVVGGVLGVWESFVTALSCKWSSKEVCRRIQE